MAFLCVNNSELGILPSKQTEQKVHAHTSNSKKQFRKILPVALGNINGPWATFYILLS